jgi:O-acetyl-ADP-ribose deacetylase (regulator of RNase III)
MEPLSRKHSAGQVTGTYLEEDFMLQYAKGDLIKSVTKGVVMHSCNCLGVMGAGFALQLKYAYPKNFDLYKKCCDRVSGLDPASLLGEMIITRENDVTIINAFGQVGTGGRRATSYDALDKIFYDLYHKHS